MEKQYITVSVHKNPDTGLLEIDDEETQKRLEELNKSSYFDEKVKEFVNYLENCREYKINFNNESFHKWLKKELVSISLDAIHDSEIQNEAFNYSEGT